MPKKQKNPAPQAAIDRKVKAEAEAKRMAEWRALYAKAKASDPVLFETLMNKAAEEFFEEVPWNDPQFVAQFLKHIATWLTKKASAFAWRTGDSEIAGMYAKARKYQEDWRTVLKKRFPDKTLPKIPALAGTDFYAGMFNLADYCNLIADDLDERKAKDGPGKEEAGGGAESQATPETDTTLIYQADAAEVYNIPKSVLCKAAKRKPSEPGYLWSGRDGKGKGKRKRVWYRKKDLVAIARSRKAVGRAGQSSQKPKEKLPAQVAPRVSNGGNLEKNQRAFLANIGQSDTESED